MDLSKDGVVARSMDGLTEQLTGVDDSKRLTQQEEINRKSKVIELIRDLLPAVVVKLASPHVTLADISRLTYEWWIAQDAVFGAIAYNRISDMVQPVASSMAATTPPNAAQLLQLAVVFMKAGRLEAAQLAENMAKKAAAQEDDLMSGLISPQLHTGSIGKYKNASVYEDLSCAAKKHEVHPNEMLPHERKFVAELRWLNMCLEGVSFSLEEIKSKRADGSANELVYHPALLWIMQHASAGQQQLRFLEETKSPDSDSREDVRTLVTVDGQDKLADPIECKARIACGADVERAMDANSDGIGKLLRVQRSNWPKQSENDDLVRFGILAERIHRFFIFKFQYGRTHQVCDIQVCPALPKSKQDASSDSILVNLRRIDEQQQPTFSTVLAPTVPAIFRFLCRFVDQVCVTRRVPVSQLTLVSDGKELPVSSLGRILHTSRKSVVIELQEHVLKFSSTQAIETEHLIHRRVDGHKHIRSSSGLVTVTGVGAISAVKLSGKCRGLESKDVDTQQRFEQHLNAAVSALRHMHQHEVLHRDVKPQNFLIEEKTGNLLLNDFDNSRFFDGDSSKDKSTGTKGFAAPFYDHEVKYCPVHDFRSVLLSFHFLATAQVSEDRAVQLTYLSAMRQGTVKYNCHLVKQMAELALQRA